MLSSQVKRIFRGWRCL